MDVLLTYCEKTSCLTKLYGMHFVWEVFICEQETQMKAVAFITIIVACIVATNQKAATI